MSREKNDTIKEIELLLIRMILLKNINVKATSDDIEVYDDLFLAKDRKIAQINEMASTNPYYVQKYYLRKKKIYFEFITSLRASGSIGFILLSFSTFAFMP